MSSAGGGWSWSKIIPGFGSKPIPPVEPIAADAESDAAATTSSDSFPDAAATDASAGQSAAFDNAGGSDGIPSIDDSMTKIYGSIPAAPEADALADVVPDADVVTDPAIRIAEQIAAFEPTWWPSDQILVWLNYVHETAGFDHFALAIAASTIAFRAFTFPVFVNGQRNSSRMGHVQPELKAIQQQVEAMGPKVDQETQMRVSAQTRALFKKYDCNPVAGLAAPLLTAPVFISMFVGLRNSPDIFPDLLATGGMLWFPDLTLPDPYMIMPFLSAGTFLAMTEVGKDQMMASDPQRGKVMVNAFRALAVIMVPITMNFNSAVFVYWTANNTWSFAQALLLRQPAVKKYFGIWDPPKPVPGQEPKGIFAEISSMMEKKKEKPPNALAEDRIKAHNEIIEQQKIVREKLMEKEGLQAKRSKGRRRK